MPPAKRNNMMAALSEDVIFEIILRLPLKHAIQCTILNKKMHRLISQRKNSLISSSYPYPAIKSTIFYRHSDNIFKRFTPPNRELSITLPESTPTGPLIMDSCNGLLLIAFPPDRPICVFNPITGGTTFVGQRFDPFKLHAVKLAVDLDDNSTGFHYKLVTVNRAVKSVSGDYSGDVYTWIISVLVPSPGPRGLTRWSVNPVETVGSANYSEPVYVHGCMYWPQRGKGNIVFLHVKEEKTGTISWPFSSGSAAFLCGSVVDGSLQSVGQLGDEIDINWYDKSKDEWVLKHRVVNSVANSRVESFDGQRLLIVQEYEEEMDIDGFKSRGYRAMVHDVLSNRWDKIKGSEDLWSVYDHRYTSKTFFSFVPTLAKVSDKYLRRDAKTEFLKFLVYDVFASLQGLQRLITQQQEEED